MSAVVCASLLTACGAKSAPDILQQSTQPVASWESTGTTVASEWAKGHVPTTYARMTLETAAKAVRAQHDRLAAAPGRDSAAAAALVRYDRLSSFLNRLAGAIGAGSRDSVVKLLSPAHR